MNESRVPTIHQELLALGTPEKAAKAAVFFKTGEGQYGAGDIFIGVTMPELRQVAKRHLGLSLEEAVALLHSAEHELRMVALLIWTYQFAAGDEATCRAIYEAYLANAARINNWDLVDASAAQIVGGWLLDKDRSVLDELAGSKLIWERRIAIVAPFHFILRGQPDDTLRIAALLLGDTHDLIQKATGWMLREVGKRCSQEAEETFLRAHYKVMPRTMLRYAIERFEPELKLAYMQGTI